MKNFLKYLRLSGRLPVIIWMSILISVALLLERETLPKIIAVSFFSSIISGILIYTLYEYRQMKKIK